MVTRTYASTVGVELMVEIFIVDPHQLTRVGLVTVLSQEEDLNICGFADSPESAWGNIIELNPNLILVDLPLLGDSGVEFAEQIKVRLPNSKLVVFSASSDDSALLRVMGAGAHAYIFKGCSADMLICAIHAVHAGASWMDPLIARRLIELNTSMHSGTKAGAAPLPNTTKETQFETQSELLSPREQQVLTFLVLGLRNKQIAAELGISGDTIKTHVRHILEKLNVTTRTEAAVQATRLGLCASAVVKMRAVV